MSRVPFETLEGQGAPTVRQLAVFLDNRLGQLVRVTKVFENRDLRILALAVVDSVDFAVVRLMVSDPERGLQLLREAGFAVNVQDLLVVKLPPGRQTLLAVWSALLGAEINVAYAYPLLGGILGSAIAVKVDNPEIATETLKRSGFELLDETDLAR